MNNLFTDTIECYLFDDTVVPAGEVENRRSFIRSGTAQELETALAMESKKLMDITARPLTEEEIKGRYPEVLDEDGRVPKSLINLHPDIFYIEMTAILAGKSW